MLSFVSSLSFPVPPSLLSNFPRIKVEVAIGRGIKKYDKREAVKEREIKRGFEKIMKSF